MAKDELEQLRNIGPKVARYMREVGIESEAQLLELGPLAAFYRLRQLHKHLNHRMLLWALYGALSDQDAMRLPEETKEWLEQELAKGEEDEAIRN